MGEIFTALQEPRGNPKSACHSVCTRVDVQHPASCCSIHSLGGMDVTETFLTWLHRAVQTDMLQSMIYSLTGINYSLTGSLPILTWAQPPGMLELGITANLCARAAPDFLIQGRSRLTSDTLTELRSRREQPP